MTRRDVLKALGLLAAAPLVEPLVKAGSVIPYKAIADTKRYDVLSWMFVNDVSIAPGQAMVNDIAVNAPDAHHFMFNQLGIYLDSRAKLDDLVKLLDSCRFNLQIGNLRILDAALCHLSPLDQSDIGIGPVQLPMPLTPALIVRPKDQLKTAIARELTPELEISEPVRFQIVMSGWKAYAV
jgi:hypothetical protein